MKSRSERKDQGGIVSFVVIGAVLVVLLAGGLYLSKHQARVNHETGVQVTTTSTTSETPSSETTPPADDSQSAPPDSSTQSTPQQATPDTNTTPSTATDSATDTTTIASTGPTETIIGLIVTSGIAFTLYRLFLSRKHLHHTALTTK